MGSRAGRWWLGPRVDALPFGLCCQLLCSCTYLDHQQRMLTPAPPPHPSSPAPPRQVVGSTGYVVAPYLEYPQLLGVLLRMLSEGAPAARREVMRVLGTIGALDPHTHKLNLAQLQGEGRLEREGVRPQFPNKNPPELGGCCGPLVGHWWGGEGLCCTGMPWDASVSGSGSC